MGKSVEFLAGRRQRMLQRGSVLDRGRPTGPLEFVAEKNLDGVSMRQHIKLAFTDFWGGFNPRDNYFTRLLSTDFDVEVCDNPDFLIYSCFGKNHRQYRCTRIFYTGENERPNFRECDYAFSFDYCIRPDHLRLPLYLLYGDPEDLIKLPASPHELLAQKTKFCNFVFSNPRCKIRNRFFELLSRYKRVDSAGRWLNNVGAPVKEKRSFIRDYKFTIAFENNSFPGYTTEKIFEPFQEFSVPIYWGNPLVHLDFNPRSFINYYDYGSLQRLVERVIEVDQSDELYCQYLSQPRFHNNVAGQFASNAYVLEQFAKIFVTPITPVAQRSRWAKLLRNRYYYKAA